jgi:protein-disulfide isomerase
VLTGKARYVFKNFPLGIHPEAQKAAESAECAGEQGQYWAMHEMLFGRQAEWSGSPDALATFKAFAKELKLDQTKFDTCLDGGTYAAAVAADLQEGSQLGVTGTPAFFVNGGMLSGAQPLAAFQQQIEYYLAGGKPPTLEVAADSYNSLGEATAAVVITEFSDFQ